MREKQPVSIQQVEKRWMMGKGNGEKATIVLPAKEQRWWSGVGGHHILPPHPCTGFPGGLDGKRIYLQCRRFRFSPWVKKIPWRREWLPTPVFLPKEFHGQRSLAGYSPQSGKESDRTEQLTHTHPGIRKHGAEGPKRLWSQKQEWRGF